MKKLLLFTILACAAPAAYGMYKVTPAPAKTAETELKTAADIFMSLAHHPDATNQQRDALMQGIKVIQKTPSRLHKYTPHCTRYKKTTRWKNLGKARMCGLGSMERGACLLQHRTGKPCPALIASRNLIQRVFTEHMKPEQHEKYIQRIAKMLKQNEQRRRSFFDAEHEKTVARIIARRKAAAAAKAVKK